MIVLKPGGGPRIVLYVAAAIALAAATILASRWGRLGPVDRTWMAVAVGSLGLFALDGLQRRYELRSRRIRVRHLFVLWRVYELPPELGIKSDRYGRLVLSSFDTPIVTLPRQYNRLGELEKRFWHMRVFTDPVSIGVPPAAAPVPPHPATRPSSLHLGR